MANKKSGQGQNATNRRGVPLSFVICALFCLGFFGFLTYRDHATVELENQVYLNGSALELADGATIELELLSVENGITITTAETTGQTVTVNGEKVEDSLYLDITAITREETLTVTVSGTSSSASCTVNLMPSTFGDYTTEGESLTAGDFYLTTYDESVNYIFKLDNTGNLIFYKCVGEDNALDFRKVYNSDGEIRYTYMPYLENEFAGISGINPGCVIVMDEDYNVIDEIYYTTSSGESALIDPHGFIYIDDGHYILTSYEDLMVEVPEDLNAVDNTAYLAVLYIQEIQDGEVLWEFCSQDYEVFLYATTDVYWYVSTDECYDYMHFNSMDIDQDDNLLVSCRNINSILKLDRETGELIWVLGGSEDEFGLTDEQLFSKQHSIIVTDDGSYMIFNNANDEVGAGTEEYSSIIRLRVDEETMTVTEYLEYDTGFFSNYMGAIREVDSEQGVYLWSVGGNYLGLIPEYSMVEYTETDGASFIFYFNDGYRRLYCANKCE